MLVDAIVKTKNINKDIKRIDIFSPKYKSSRRVISLDISYEGRPVKFASLLSDVPKNIVMINKCPFLGNPDSLSFIRGMIIECKDDENVYILMNEIIIKK